MSEPKFLGYRCTSCATEHGPENVRYLCPEDGGLLRVILDFDAVRAEHSPRSLGMQEERSLWRYLPLLPVADPGQHGTPLRAAGWTPLLRPTRLAARLGLQKLWLKDDGRNPTASFKDRASAVVVARAREIEVAPAVTASTGNAGAALAGMGAAVGLPTVILAPRTAPPAKIAQLLVFGAQVYLVDGNYDQAFDLSIEAAEAFGWYCRNTGYNPFTAEGKKTAAFEISEQLARTTAGSPGEPPERWRAPHAVFVSVGDGNIITGVHQGFEELMALGWIERMPRLYGVQAEGSAAVAQAFASGSDHIEPVRAQTLADSIAVDLPRDGIRALRAVRESGGEYITVKDEAILAAIAELGREAAVFAEPAGAAAYAGLQAAVRDQRIEADEDVVVLITGNGLKDIAAAAKSTGEAPVIQPTIEDLARAAGGLHGVSGQGGT